MLSRQAVLTSAAVVTLLLVGWTAWRDVNLATPTSSDPRAARSRTQVAATHAAASMGGVSVSASASGNSAMLEFNRDPLLEARIDPFKVVSFLPPAPKVSAAPVPLAPVVPPKPVAPPLPYRYFGRMVDIQGKAITYLTREGELIAIKEQQLLDNVYRIDSIGQQQITLTYLPLNEKAQISVQSAQE